MTCRNKNSFYGLILFFTCAVLSCHQPENKPSTSDKTVQLPALMNDSILLSIDKSPMDMIYFPEDYPKQKMLSSNTDNLSARVIYSRPQRKDRIIFADTSVKENFIQHYGQEWRLGANEATEIELFKDAMVDGKKIPHGRYILYCIPYPGKWKIIFNTNLFSWGLHIDRTKDLVSAEFPVTQSDIKAEYFTMLFQKSAQGCNLVMMWGDIKVVMPISFS